MNIEVYPYYVWMTQSEAQQLAHLTDPTDIDDYLSQLDVQVVPADQFDRWRRGAIKPE
ncbi:MAG: hypothetical protein F6K39_40095 [Okeania sp. SIO3B3]|nr:hypothetical protein [Okeania sp. SIO3B3]